MSDVTQHIRRLRAQSNAAIAARDAGQVVSFMTPDVVVAVAGGPVLRGAEASRLAFMEQFAESNFVGYVRSPQHVHAQEPPQTATERGTWVGRWRSRGGEHIQSGHYTAEWAHSAMGWLICKETFVGGA